MLWLKYIALRRSSDLPDFDDFIAGCNTVPPGVEFKSKLGSHVKLPQQSRNLIKGSELCFGLIGDKIRWPTKGPSERPRNSSSTNNATNYSRNEHASEITVCVILAE